MPALSGGHMAWIEMCGPNLAGDEEHNEELFGQLWAVPNPDRVPRAIHGGSCLFWIRKDLVRARWIKREDLHPVSKEQRITEKPITLSWARNLRPGGRDKATYAEVLMRIPMADGGRWVWQTEKPPHAQFRGRPQRCRGAVS
jgi:hypothetical protein